MKTVTWPDKIGKALNVKVRKASPNTLVIGSGAISHMMYDQDLFLSMNQCIVPTITLGDVRTITVESSESVLFHITLANKVKYILSCRMFFSSHPWTLILFQCLNSLLMDMILIVLVEHV